MQNKTKEITTKQAFIFNFIVPLQPKIRQSAKDGLGKKQVVQLKNI